MKRTKLLALICALAMTVTALAGCGESEVKVKNDDKKPKIEEQSDVKVNDEDDIADDDDEVEVNDEDDIKDVVKSYFDAYTELNGEEAAKYVSQASELYEQILDMKDYVQDNLLGDMSNMSESLEALGLDADEFKEKMVGLIEDIVKDTDVTVDEVKLSDDKATVTVTMTAKIPTEDSFGSEKVQNLVMEKAKNYSSEEELLNDFVNIIFEIIEEVIEDVEPTTKTMTANLEKINGTWLIVGFSD